MASATDDEEHIQAVVELCMVTEDLSPLLKLILEAEPETNGVNARNKANNADPSSESTGVNSSKLTSHAWSMVEIVNKLTKKLAAEQDKAILQVCQANAVEISHCVSELHALHASIARLKDLVAQGNGALSTGSSLLSCAEGLGELSVARSRTTDGLALLSSARVLLAQCRDAGEILTQGRKLRALLLLSRVKKGPLESLALLASSTSSVDEEQTAFARLKGAANAPTPNSQAMAGGGSGEMASHVRSFFLGERGLIKELVAAAEQLAIDEFNHWLLSIRTLSQKVGLRAVRRAAADRKLQESLSRERELALGLMQQGIGLREIARLLFKGKDAVRGGPDPQSFRQALRVEGGAGSTPGVHEVCSRVDASGPSLSAHEGKPLAALREILAWERGRCMELCPQPLKPSSAPPPLPSYQPGKTQSQPQPHLGDTKRSSDNASRRFKTLFSNEASQQPPGSVKPSIPPPSLESTLPPSTCTASSLDHPGLPSSLVENDTVMPLMEPVNMSAMLRCVQVHQQLGLTKKLSTYYKEQRKLQVASDLLPPPNFLEHYQAYFARLSGFFVIERHVQLLEPSLVTQEHVNALWESACSTLKTSLDSALEGVRTTYILLLVKDFVLLMCGAMEAMGYSVVILEEVLAGHRQRYHDLLLSNAMESSVKLLQGDPLDRPCPLLPLASSSSSSSLVTLSSKRPMQAKGATSVVKASEEQPVDEAKDPRGGQDADEGHPQAKPQDDQEEGEPPKASTVGLQGRSRNSVEALGLPLTLPGIGPPPSSTLAPFTPCVPGLVEEVRKYVVDSLAYLEGLVPDWELASAVFSQRNRMISKVLVDSMQSKVTLCVKRNDVLGAMHMATNAWSIVQSMDALDAWTLEKARPRSLHPAEDFSSSSTNDAEGRARKAKAQSRSRQAVFAQDIAASNSVRASIRAVQDHAERCAAVLLTRRGTKIFETSAKTLPWLPTEPHKAGQGRSKYVEELIAVLEETYTLGRATLPRPSFLSLCRVVTRSVGNGLVSLLSPLLSSASPRDVLSVASDASAAATVGPVRPAPVPSYNLLAVRRLLGEVREIKAAAAEKCGVPELSIEEEMTEAEQLCEVLLADKIEEVLDESVRRKKYPELGLITIALAMERYRELTWIGKDKTNFPTRREMTDVANVLRIQLEKKMETGKW